MVRSCTVFCFDCKLALWYRPLRKIRFVARGHHSGREAPPDDEVRELAGNEIEEEEESEDDEGDKEDEGEEDERDA